MASRGPRRQTGPRDRVMAAGSYNRSRVSREVRGLSIPRTRAFDWSPRDGARLSAAVAARALRPGGERLRALARGALPQACALCAAPAGGALVCAACATSLPRVRSACPVCALPAADGTACGACLSRPPPFAATVAALVYAFPADRLLQQLKYGGRLAFADWAADELAAAALAALRSRDASARPDCVVAAAARARAPAGARLQPGPRDRRARGAARRPAAPARARARPPAARRRPRCRGRRRKANVRGAFVVARGADVRGRSIALVDDVMTTGATLAEAALDAAPRRCRARRVLGRRPDAAAGAGVMSAPAGRDPSDAGRDAIWPSSSSTRRFPAIPATSSGSPPTPATALHLVEPLGFRMADRDLRRAGLDYHEYATRAGPPRLRRLPRGARRAVPAPLVRAHDGRRAVGLRRPLRARRRAGVRLRERGPARGRARRLRRRRPAADSDAPADAQPQPVERGGGDRVRGVAPAGFAGAG